MTISIYHQDNLEFLKTLPDNHINLIFTDPPFNSGKQMCRKVVKKTLDENGNIGFGGNKYKTEIVSTTSYNDSFDNYIDGFLRPRMEQARRILKDDGSMYLLLDYREVHYAKVMMDEIFGRENFINELIWHWDYGAKSKTKWSCKHNNILFYAKDKNNYTFNYNNIPRIPYMAPGLAGPEKAARGKIITDCWFHTVVPTNGKQKTGYSTQKPLGILRPIVNVSSNPGDLCMDFFAGSGSFGVACKELGRDCILIDENPEAIKIMNKQFGLT